jgi:hypothetical protein
VAIRSLHEGSMLMKQLAARTEAAEAAGEGTTLAARAEALDRRADALRMIVTSGSGLATK